MPHNFEKVAALWKADKRRWVKPSTYATYTALANRHVIPFFSREEVLLDEASAQAFVDRKLEEGLSVKSVKDAVLVLKLIARFGQKAGEWPPLEMNLHFPAPAAPQHPSALTRAQQKKLQDYLRDHFTFRNLGILICLESGLRIGELCALQWRDLDVTGGVIHVTKTVQRIYLADGDERQYFLHFGPPKTTSSLRDVPMEGGLLKLIRPFARLMRPDYYVLSGSDVPVEPRTCRASYRKVLRELGLPPLRFHALRHSFATRCIESQCDYKTVSVILGHASISTTMDLYVHPGLDEKKRCIERMARALR